MLAGSASGVASTRTWLLLFGLALMISGDAAAMDCRLVHYSGANASAAPRVQLSATFRRGERTGDSFTYQLRDSLPPLTLGDVVKIQ